MIGTRSWWVYWVLVIPTILSLMDGYTRYGPLFCSDYNYYTIQNPHITLLEHHVVALNNHLEINKREQHVEFPIPHQVLGSGGLDDKRGT